MPLWLPPGHSCTLEKNRTARPEWRPSALARWSLLLLLSGHRRADAREAGGQALTLLDRERRRTTSAPLRRPARCLPPARKAARPRVGFPAAPPRPGRTPRPRAPAHRRPTAARQLALGQSAGTEAHGQDLPTTDCHKQWHASTVSVFSVCISLLILFL
jgi:hypothetical protein